MTELDQIPLERWQTPAMKFGRGFVQTANGCVRLCGPGQEPLIRSSDPFADDELDQFIVECAKCDDPIFNRTRPDTPGCVDETGCQVGEEPAPGSTLENPQCYPMPCGFGTRRTGAKCEPDPLYCERIRQVKVNLDWGGINDLKTWAYQKCKPGHLHARGLEVRREIESNIDKSVVECQEVLPKVLGYLQDHKPLSENPAFVARFSDQFELHDLNAALMGGYQIKRECAFEGDSSSLADQPELPEIPKLLSRDLPMLLYKEGFQQLSGESTFQGR